MPQTETIPTSDRLIWLSLLCVLAAALVADQARANLHREARAGSAATALVDSPLTAAGWCRMHRDVLAGDEAIGFHPRLHESRTESGDRRPRHADASH